MTTFLPRRDDEVAAWLRKRRDAFPLHTIAHNVVEEMLDTYRLHADTRTPLDQHACEGGTPDDCYGCYEETQQPAPGPLTDERLQQLRDLPAWPGRELVDEAIRLRAELAAAQAQLANAVRSVGGAK